MPNTSKNEVCEAQLKAYLLRLESELESDVESACIVDGVLGAELTLRAHTRLQLVRRIIADVWKLC